MSFLQIYLAYLPPKLFSGSLSFFFPWCRQNAILLEEKEKREKEMRNQLVEEAEEYIRGFYEKRKLTVESNKTNNREREKVYVFP